MGQNLSSNPNLFESKFDRIRICASLNLSESEYPGSAHTYARYHFLAIFPCFIAQLANDTTAIPKQ